MKKFRISVLAFAAAAMVMASCKEKEATTSDSNVSTDVVTIPSTASGEKAEPGSLPVFAVAGAKHDFGKITQGEKVSHKFKFKNNGGSDLIISSAQGSCGCTVPSYPKAPIPPGGEGSIDVVFDSNGKSGKVEKTVTVVTNAEPNTTVLTVATEIIVPEGK
jgi:hypothetical protein